MAFLRDEVLLSGEAVPALGLSLHVADVALTELRGACDGGGGAAAVPWPALRVRQVYIGKVGCGQAALSLGVACARVETPLSWQRLATRCRQRLALKRRSSCRGCSKHARLCYPFFCPPRSTAQQVRSRLVKTSRETALSRFQRHAAPQALLEPFGAALAATGRPALMARVRDGVFCELAEGAGAEPAFAELDGGALSADLFALGARPGARQGATLGDRQFWRFECGGAALHMLRACG